MRKLAPLLFQEDVVALGKWFPPGVVHLGYQRAHRAHVKGVARENFFGELT
jgi:hypothetical protein